MLYWSWVSVAGAWEIDPAPNIDGDRLIAVQEDDPDIDVASELAAAIAFWDGAACTDRMPQLTVGATVGSEFDPFATDGQSVVTIQYPGYFLGYKVVYLPGAEFILMLDPSLPWVADAAAADPGCVDGLSVRQALIIGLAVGLGLLPDEGFGLIAPCAPAPAAPSDIDLAAIQTVWGPRIQLACGDATGSLASGVPFEATCTATDAYGGPIEASWTTPAGTTEGLEFVQRVTAQGTVTIDGCAHGPGCVEETCDSWTVVACDPPTAEFAVVRNAAGEILLENHTENAVDGCISSVRWTGFDAAGAPIWISGEWSPLVPPAVEATRFELEVDGPGGGSTAARGSGCTCDSIGGGSWVGGLLLPLLLSRRGRSR